MLFSDLFKLFDSSQIALEVSLLYVGKAKLKYACAQEMCGYGCVAECCREASLQGYAVAKTRKVEPKQLTKQRNIEDTRPGMQRWFFCKCRPGTRSTLRN